MKKTTAFYDKLLYAIGGLTEYIFIARADGANLLRCIVVALMSKIYTMGPTIATGLGRGVTKSIGNLIG